MYRRVATATLLLAGFILPLIASAPRITEAQKFAIIRELISEVGIARQALPVDKKGVELSAAGQVMNGGDVQQALLKDGPAARVGDRVAVTAITFKSDRIVIDLNGGPHTTHWYQHLQIGMGPDLAPVGTSQVGPRGSVVTLRFDHDVPAMTPEQFKGDLAALIDFSPPNQAEEMVKALPVAVKRAIAEHRVLVGMNTDMVVAALGRTQNKTRETDPNTGATYADWVYGALPQPTTIVRIEAGHVTQVAIYRADGTEVVDNKIDPSLAAMVQQQQQQAAQREEQASQPPPTLRRPGDAPPTLSPNSPQAAPPQNMPQNLPQDPNDPNNGMPPNGLPGSGMPTMPGGPPNGQPPVGPPTGPPICCQLPRN